MTVFEKGDRIGGLLRYGIPDFKMEKATHRPPHGADGGGRRRVQSPTRTSAHNVPVEDLRKEFDAILLDRRRRSSPRDLKVPGRELKGIHFAMEFLPQQNNVRWRGDRLESQRRFWPPASAS